MAAEEVAGIASNDFFTNSVLRKLENCNSSSGRVASKSVGYAYFFAQSITYSFGRSLSFRKKPNLAAITEYAPSRFCNSPAILILLIHRREAPKCAGPLNERGP